MLFKKKSFEYQLNNLIPLSTPLKELSCTVIDMETTGFSIGKNDRLIEIGAASIVNGNIQNETFHTYIDPKRDIPVEITRLTGIDDQKVNNAPEATNGISSLFRFIENNKSSCIIGHYVDFDLFVLKRELSREKLSFSKPKAIDTLDLIQFLYPTWDTKDLNEYAKIFNVPVFSRHTAIGDALTTAHLYRVLINEFEEKGYSTWGDLLCEIEKQKIYIG